MSRHKRSTAAPALAALSAKLADLADSIRPSVVSVRSIRRPSTGDPHSHASGVAIGPRHIVTNAHAVWHSMAARVQLDDGSTHMATVRGVDNQTDLAVLQLNVAICPPLSWASGGGPRSGELALIVSNPLALAGSHALGIVASAHRRLARTGLPPLEGAIQIDAFVAPGSSGGAVVSMRGELLGIVLARNVEHTGIAFAIPATTAEWVTRELIAHGAVRRTILGVRLQTVNAQPRPLRLRADRCVRVDKVERGSPAARAGLKAGDLIVEVAGVQAAGVHFVQRALAGSVDNVRMLIQRGSRALQVDVPLPNGAR